MERTQFTFYDSFFRALARIRKKQDRADAYDAICAYALYGTEPDLNQLPDSAAIAFSLIKPNLDASRRKADSGKRGGCAKQTGSKQEAKPEHSAGEKENKNENENEIENECYPCMSPVTAVQADYLNRINPSASPNSLDELAGFVETVGPEVCKRAFDVALDSKKATWPYIRAILQDKQKNGVKSLADWEDLEERREKEKGDAGKCEWSKRQRDQRETGGKGAWDYVGD